MHAFRGGPTREPQAENHLGLFSRPTKLLLFLLLQPLLPRLLFVTAGVPAPRADSGGARAVPSDRVRLATVGSEARLEINKQAEKRRS